LTQHHVVDYRPVRDERYGVVVSLHHSRVVVTFERAPSGAISIATWEAGEIPARRPPR
jgi:hypothetical protein